MESDIEKILGHAAVKIAYSIDADCIISIERSKCADDGTENAWETDNDFLNVSVSVFKKVRKGAYARLQYKSKIKKPECGSIIPIKELIMEGIRKDHVKKNDKVVCVVDESVGTGYKSLLFIFDVDKIFFNISIHDLAANVSPDVLEAVIKIALEISQEGREGKKVGTAFVIGEKNEVLKYTKQLIINPFFGYSDEFRKITDPNMKETIKEFAQLDGIFVIDNGGLILSTGSYLTVDGSNVSLPGYGTRHRVCASLTKEINALAVVVSSSGGKISIFKNGKEVMRL